MLGFRIWGSRDRIAESAMEKHKEHEVTSAYAWEL